MRDGAPAHGRGAKREVTAPSGTLRLPRRYTGRPDDKDTLPSALLSMRVSLALALLLCALPLAVQDAAPADAYRLHLRMGAGL